MVYCFDDIRIEEDLIDGNFQSSPLFDLALELKASLEAKHHLLGLMGLLCVIEISGRTALQFVRNTHDIRNNAECFNHFLSHYMGYGQLLQEKPRLYDILRNGMVHQGFTKEGSGFGTGYSEFFLRHLGIKEDDLRGIILANNEPELILDILLFEYVEGLKRFHQDELTHDWKYTEGWQPDSSPWI